MHFRMAVSEASPAQSLWGERERNSSRTEGKQRVSFQYSILEKKKKKKKKKKNVSRKLHSNCRENVKCHPRERSPGKGMKIAFSGSGSPRRKTRENAKE